MRGNQMINLILKFFIIILTIIVYKKGDSAIDDDDSKKYAKIALFIGEISLIIGILALPIPASVEEWFNSQPWKSSNGGSTEVESTTREAGKNDEPSETEGGEHVFPSVIPDKYYVKEEHTYGFYNAKNLGLDSYREVSDFCREQGGHLATINGPKENTFLFETLRNNYVNTAFFGYSDEKEENNWQWDYESSSYENWTKYGQQQPDDGAPHGTSEDYAEFNYDGNKEPSYNVPSDGTWNDAVFMRNTYLFICEWEFNVEKELNSN